MQKYNNILLSKLEKIIRKEIEFENDFYERKTDFNIKSAIEKDKLYNKLNEIKCKKSEIENEINDKKNELIKRKNNKEIKQNNSVLEYELKRLDQCIIEINKEGKNLLNLLNDTNRIESEFEIELQEELNIKKGNFKRRKHNLIVDHMYYYQCVDKFS